MPPEALPVAKLPVTCLWAHSRWWPQVCGPASPGLGATRGGCKGTDDSCEAPDNASLARHRKPQRKVRRTRGPRLAEGGGLGL